MIAFLQRQLQSGHNLTPYEGVMPGKNPLLSRSWTFPHS